MGSKAIAAITLGVLCTLSSSAAVHAMPGSAHQAIVSKSDKQTDTQPSAAPYQSQSAAALEQRTRVIITKGTRSDGTTQENRGSGVVVGRYFLTVFHNLQPAPREQFSSLASYLGGIRVKPVFTDPAADIAIIEIPSELCPQWCGSTNWLPPTDTALAQRVRWYRDPASAPRVNPGWRSATVTGRTLSMPAAPTVGSLGAECDSGLVLEVDRPFRPGSSGAGVWNTNNQLLGIAQGSFQTRDGRETGYFKPLRCISGHWPAQPVTPSVPPSVPPSVRGHTGGEGLEALVSNIETCIRSAPCPAPSSSKWPATTSVMPKPEP